MSKTIRYPLIPDAVATQLRAAITQPIFQLAA